MIRPKAMDLFVAIKGAVEHEPVGKRAKVALDIAGID